jgi:hypothetical protein
MDEFINKKENNNIYYFECYGKNVELDKFLSEFKNNQYKNKVIIYIKKDKEIDLNGSNHIRVRNRKSYDFHINYHNIREGSFINISINISDKDKKKIELKNTLEDIKNFITNKNPDIKIQPLSIENPNKNNDNKITFICKFIPDIESKNHRIYEIKEYLTKLLWNKDKFPIERAKKGYTELSEFKKNIIEANKKNQQIMIYPDFEPILRIQKEKSDIKIYLEYNIRQIYFVKPNIIPDPLF